MIINFILNIFLFFLLYTFVVSDSEISSKKLPAFYIEYMVFLVIESLLFGTNINFVINAIAKKSKCLENKNDSSQNNMIRKENPNDD